MDGGAADLPDDVATLKAMLLASLRREAHLQHIVSMLQRHRFGRRSEKLTPEQYGLALEDAEAATAEADALIEQHERAKGVAKPKTPRDARPSLPSHLPRIERRILPPQTACPCCAGELHVIGEDRSERLDIVPAQYRVVVTIRPRMACRTCSEGVMRAPAPPRLVPGGLPTEALIADVLVKKYADHLPLYRQAQIMKRQGIAVERAVLAGWVGRAAALLKPLVEQMKAELLRSSRLFADETTAKVLAPGMGKVKTGYFWALARDDRGHGGADPPWVVYTYMPGRGATWASKLLGEYRGVLQVDGYEGYTHLGDAKRAGGAATLAYCWAHLRRRFYDAAKGGNAPVAEDALARIAAIYAVEAKIRGAPAEVRLTTRQRDTAPLIEAFHGWMRQVGHRAFAAVGTQDAIRYALRHWEGLTRFLDDGRIELDSNVVERSMRPVALQRKNALFAGHELGAENWAAIASLVESCKLNDINPNAYLADVLTRLVTIKDGDAIDHLTPGRWIDTKAAESPFERSAIARAA